MLTTGLPKVLLHKMTEIEEGTHEFILHAHPPWRHSAGDSPGSRVRAKRFISEMPPSPWPIQTLEQQLEEMRATYQLNTEKLEYNYRVLTERDMENSATLSHQKRKLSKLKDALSGLVQVGRRSLRDFGSGRGGRR